MEEASLEELGKYLPLKVAETLQNYLQSRKEMKDENIK